jgi:hypothetical protein
VTVDGRLDLAATIAALQAVHRRFAICVARKRSGAST